MNLETNRLTFIDGGVAAPGIGLLLAAVVAAAAAVATTWEKQKYANELIIRHKCAADPQLIRSQRHSQRTRRRRASN